MAEDSVQEENKQPDEQAEKILEEFMVGFSESFNESLVKSLREEANSSKYDIVSKTLRRTADNLEKNRCNL